MSIKPPARLGATIPGRMGPQQDRDRQMLPVKWISPPRRGALLSSSLCASGLLVSTVAIMLLVEFDHWYPVRALIFFAIAVLLMMAGLKAHRPQGHHPHALRFGFANAVTLCRVAVIALLAAGAGEALAGSRTLAWGAVGLATAAALLDAIDGPLARRSGLASAFGARFDMETDALLVLVLCLLLVHFGKVGNWILAAGLLRYAFVAAGWIWRWLAEPLAPSGRRKAVCVFQIVTLIVALGPIVDRPASGWIAATGLAALTISFAIDAVWLARRRSLS